MERRIWNATALCAALMLAVPISAAWSPITFGFVGTVSNGIAGLFETGAAVSGRYTFDSSAADVRPSDPSQGWYFSQGDNFGWAITVGNVTYVTSPGTSNPAAIRVFNGASADGYEAAGSALTGAGRTISALLGNMLLPVTTFTTDSVPVLPPSGLLIGNLFPS